MAKTTTRKRGRARPQAARRRTRPASVRKTGFRPQAPIRETDSEDQAGAYGNDRGETDIPLT
jgi:hypothetical protein